MARYPRANDVRIETQSTLTRRRSRRPQHSWAIGVRPWQICPCMIAPVLPGESLKSASMQMRMISDPIVSPLQGWWLEWYLFYVRFGDLFSPADANYRAMISDPSAPGLATSPNVGDLADWNWYHGGNTTGAPWYKNIWKDCYGPIVRAYFRKEGQEPGTTLINSYDACRFAGANGLDTLYTDLELGTPTGADLWAKQWAAFQVAREAKLTTNTWEEYLAQSGVSTPPKLVEPQKDFQIPELVRFVRDFAYPTATVNQADGTIKTTVQWSMAERIDKRRFFAEPGFLCGIVVVRPKAYTFYQNGSLTDLYCTSNYGWPQPAYDTDPHTTMVSHNAAATPAGVGVVRGSSTVHWTDVKDLYLYGDQFINFDPQSIPAGMGSGITWVRIPKPALTNKTYPDITDSQMVFVDGGGAGTAQFLHGDGICSLRIATRLGETTN